MGKNDSAQTHKKNWIKGIAALIKQKKWSLNETVAVDGWLAWINFDSWAIIFNYTLLLKRLLIYQIDVFVCVIIDYTR